MKIAVMSDIHGNYKALVKCLEHAEAQGVDKYIFLGDYLGEYPYPQRTMDILYAIKDKYDCVFLRGNKEDYWINLRKGENCDWKNGNHSIQAMLHSYKNLKPKDIDYFETLPISQCIKYNGMEPIMVCHGAPEANRTKLMPDDEKTKEIVEGYEEKYIICGHTHQQGIVYERGSGVIDEHIDMHGEKIVLNAGAVGVPLHAKESAQYLLLTSVGNEWDYEFVSLPYDIEDVINDIHESGLWEITPYWCRITAHLLRTGETPHGTVLSEVMRLNEYRDAWYNIDESYWEDALKTYGID